MTDLAIKIENISKVYRLYEDPVDRLKESLHPFRRKYHNEFYALKGVSLEVKKGETVGIIGKNGCGKSTLLQIITGVLTPTTGTVMVNGKIAALLELGAGFNPELSGIENVYFTGALMGFSREEMDMKIEQILSFADIGEFVYQPVKNYSSGMFLRLAFAANIASDPEVMIVDEALAVGDMNFQAKCMTALTRIQERGATVLFVSHDIEALKSLCSRGIYLERGAVKSIGMAGDVAEQYVRAMREEMNQEYAAAKPLSDMLPKANLQLENQRSAVSHEFKVCKEFKKKVEYFRYGEGGAEITFAELLDMHLRPINSVDFNQIVFIRIYFKTTIDNEISCNYYILDDKRNLILGAGLSLAGQPFMTVKNGGEYIVTYKTRLPLHEGNYSCQLQITKTVVQNTTAKFLDVIDDAIIFKMSRREDVRLWAKVFVKNEVEIISC